MRGRCGLNATGSSLEIAKPHTRPQAGLHTRDHVCLGVYAWFRRLGDLLDQVWPSTTSGLGLACTRPTSGLISPTFAGLAFLVCFLVELGCDGLVAARS